MRKSSKIIALVLAVVMVFMLIPVTTVSAANIPAGTVLYLVPSANWNQSNARFAAYFFGSGEAWVSMTKVAGQSNLYQVTVPSGSWTNVIFCRMNPSASANNWNNKWNQTSDLTYNGTSNCYTVKEGTWDKGGGTWSTYGSACSHANVGEAATCTKDQVCLDCGDPVASALGHTYNSANLCTRCNTQATFTVAGSGAHLGTEWDTGNTANDMTYADGVYTKVYTNVAAGSYLLKVARDHDWGTAYPSSDKAYTVATSGSTVTVTLKGTAVTVTVEAPHVCAFSDPTCTEPGKCSCGLTQGEALGHNYVEGVCSRCEAADPDYVPLISGTGTEEDPFVIGSLEALIAFRDSVNAGETKYNAEGVYVTLGADIDMAGVDWSVNIGDDCNATFDGIFDGKGHKISNLTAKETAQKADVYVCGGLFGAIYGNAVIKNLTIENVSIDAGEFTGNNVAAVVGFVYAGKGSIENVTVCGKIEINAPGIYGVGAIVGYSYQSNITIKDCKVVGAEGSYINASSGAGAVAGYANGVHVADATVSGLEITASGLIGGIFGITSGTCDVKGATVSDVTLTATKDVWVNSTGVAVGTISTNGVEVSGVTFENVTGADTVVGSAYAEKPTTVVPAVQAKIGDKYYTTLEAAFAAAKGETVSLASDVELSSALVIEGTAVLDLNGYELSYTSETMGEAMITNKGNLTINDSVGTGVINYNYVGANDASYGKGNYTISNGGTLTVNGGKITIANLRSHAKYPIDNNNTTGDAILVINGGHLYNYNTSAIRMFCNSTTYKNSVTINGGLIEGYCAVWVQNPGKNTVNCDLTITGGELRTTAAAYVNGTAELKDVSSAIYCTIAGEGGAWSESSFITISGGTFNENVYLSANAPVVTINAGATFNGYVEHDHTYEEGKCVCGAEDPNYEPPHVHKDTGLDAKCDECGEWFLPTSPFKLEMYQASKKQTYYFTGAMSGYYFATSTDITKAVDLYAEAVEGGYNVYFMNGSTKNYLYIELSGTHINAKFGSTKAVWYVDETYGCLTTEISGTKYFLGTYSSYVTFGGTAYSRLTASTADVSQYVGRAVSRADHVCADFTSKVTNPTCTAQGYTTKTCTACGVATKVDYVDALGHNLEDVQGLEPTCTATGYTAYKDCSRCTYVEGKETLAKVAHTYENCACTVCGAVLPTLDVTDSFQFTTQEAFDAAVAGGKLAFTDTFRDNGGSFQFNTNSTIQFVAPAKSVVTVTGHSAQYGVFNIYLNGEKADITASNGVYTFAVAEETKVVIATGDNGASYSYIKGISLEAFIDRTIASDVEITFGSEGNYKESIVDFSGIQIGDNGGNNSQVKNGSFNLELKAGAVVTIHGYPGYTSYKLNDGEAIESEYYTYIALTDTVLTVTPVSGNNYFYSIEVKFHEGITLVEAKDPTCTEAGHAAHYVCDCHDEPLTDKGTIDALGHDYDASVTEPTCTEAGYTTYTCGVCDHSYTGDEVEALGHTFVYGKCTVCGAADPDYVPYVNTLVVGDTNKIVVDGDTFNAYNLPIEWVAFVADEKAEYTFVGDNGALVYIFDAEYNSVCGYTGTAVLEAGTYLICIGNGAVGEMNVAVTKTAIEVPHEHEFVEGKCECGEIDPDYVEPHEHEFVEGKCECGEIDPDYVEPQPPVDGGEGPVDFFQMIINFFMQLIEFFKNLFKF